MNQINNIRGAYGQTAQGPRTVQEFVASGALTANQWVSRTGPYTVETMDVSDGDVAGLLCAGVALETVASGATVRVVTFGEAVCGIGTTTIAAVGDIAVPHASTDGASGSIAASAIGESTQDVQIGVYASVEIGTSNTATVVVVPPSRTGGVEAGAIGTSSIADDAVTTAKLAVPRTAVISETVLIGGFTDNGDTTGYIDLGTQLEAGAIPVGWKCVVATGFTGDTTAVVQIGVAGDLDRFSADTAQSVLAAATVGSNILAADASDGMNAAQTIRVTVTGGADFTSITAGNMAVSVYYLETVD